MFRYDRAGIFKPLKYEGIKIPADGYFHFGLCIFLILVQLLRDFHVDDKFQRSKGDYFINSGPFRTIRTSRHWNAPRDPFGRCPAGGRCKALEGEGAGGAGRGARPPEGRWRQAEVTADPPPLQPTAHPPRHPSDASLGPCPFVVPPHPPPSPIRTRTRIPSPPDGRWNDARSAPTDSPSPLCVRLPPPLLARVAATVGMPILRPGAFILIIAQLRLASIQMVIWLPEASIT